MVRRSTLWITLIATILGIALLHAVHVLRPVEDALQYIFVPIGRVFSGLGQRLGRNRGMTGDVTALQNQVQDLNARIAALSVDYVKLKSLEEENRSLRDAAKFLSTSGYDHVGANVIARSIDPMTATILIDRGSRDGLETGMAVVVGDGVLVGKIVSLQENVSTVMLVADHRSRVAASPIGARKMFGMVQGDGNGVARLTLIPQAEDLNRDDIIVTAGTEEKVPPNLAIALVNEVEGKATDPFKTASLQPLAETDDLDLVIVLRPTALRPDSNH